MLIYPPLCNVYAGVLTLVNRNRNRDPPLLRSPDTWLASTTRDPVAVQPVPATSVNNSSAVVVALLITHRSIVSPACAPGTFLTRSVAVGVVTVLFAPS